VLTVNVGFITSQDWSVYEKKVIRFGCMRDEVTGGSRNFMEDICNLYSSRNN
jgi:hypothetical protein